MVRKVTNKEIEQLAKEGFVPGIPAQGPITIPKTVAINMQLDIICDKVYCLHLVNPKTSENLKYYYDGNNTETHLSVKQWCNSFIEFTKWSAKIYCNVTQLNFESKNNFDHPKNSSIGLRGLVSYFNEKMDWKAEILNENGIIVFISWIGNCRSKGEIQIKKLQYELNSISINKNIGFTIHKIHWVDPKTFVEVGDTVMNINVLEQEIASFSQMQEDSKKFYLLSCSINGYYSQTTIRSKIILGFHLIEDYFLTPYKDIIKKTKLFEMNKTEKKFVKNCIYNSLERYITEKVNWKGENNYNIKLKESISQITSWKVNSPNAILSQRISEYKNQPLDVTNKEIKRLQTIRSTLAHTYTLGDKTQKDYLWAIRYIDRIILLIIKNEINALL